MIVIGVGNELRRDDGAAPAVIMGLRGRCPDHVRLVICDGEPARLIDLWTGADLAVVIDAVRPHGRPGRIHQSEDVLADARSDTSSHGLGPGMALALGRTLQRMPHRLHIYAIEGGDFGLGIGLSPPVRRAVTEVTDRIAALVRQEA